MFCLNSLIHKKKKKLLTVFVILKGLHKVHIFTKFYSTILFSEVYFIFVFSDCTLVKSALFMNTNNLKMRYVNTRNLVPF